MDDVLLIARAVTDTLAAPETIPASQIEGAVLAGLLPVV